MDLGGLIGVDDGLVTSASSFHGGDVLSSFHGRHDWSCLKMAKTEASSLLPDGEQPLDFSASKPESLLLTSDGRVPTSSYTGHAGKIKNMITCFRVAFIQCNSRQLVKCV